MKVFHEREETKQQKSGAGLLIFLCWLLYACSYIGKVNYSANIAQIRDFYDVTKSQAGLVSTLFFFAYGAGQVFNGIFCRKYNIKWMIFSVMITSGAINFVIAVTTNFAIIKWLWLLNGAALSVLWPTLIRLLAESLPKKDLAKSSVVIGTTVACGTLVIYGLSSVYATFHAFKLAFYTAALVAPTVAIVWLCLYKRAVNAAKTAKASEEESTQPTVDKDVRKIEQKKGERKILYLIIGGLCFCAVGVNFIKDGLTTWVPSILKEEFSLNDSLSILLTLFLPVLAIFGNLCALTVHKKIADYVTHCAVVFAVVGALVALIIGCLSWKQMVLTLIGLAVVVFLVSSLNSLITSIFPTFMRGKVNSGLFAGILNGFCYLGSTISSYGLGFIADRWGWTAVFWTLFAFCLAVCVVWIGYILLREFFKKQDERAD